ncbi:predicted protein [Naegleria gruberi]|uniref:Predicted protein n=1 Tax=Naegleria gruberi TaxID=5762 RepID=D2VXX6_NAEGR|nr:uncharacterized protein NAEGRDRAFT_53131 [Naegleria gruberi]EFC38369.1 predicted protein [Naegleria gruberi]|eukprot:XP_002671113.1 predicted protein [Naegleria gruberi strain NEG-M]
MTALFISFLLLLCTSLKLSHATTYPVYNISNFLGGGSVLGDGGLAVNAKVEYTEGVAVNSKGEVLVVQNFYGRVRKVDKNGYVTTIAGFGTSGDSSGNGGLATNAMLGYPAGITVNDKDEIYLVEYGTHMVRKILVNGTIQEFAGILNGGGFGGDNGLATNAIFNHPYGVSVNPLTGDVYISDFSNNRIRKVDSSGIISTYVGTGNTEYGADDILAVNANINSPYYIATGPNGDLYIPLVGSSRICKVSYSTGKITTIAGTGAYGYSGDGGLAINAVIRYPKSIAIGKHGEIFFTDSDNQVIRRITPDGIITTIAGTGNFGYSGDGGLATSADISKPTGIAVDSNGTIYFCDNNNNRVRKLVPYCLDGKLVNGTCEFSCFGIKNNLATVCNGHGNCLATNSCLCDSGWKGNVQCSQFSCDGLNNCNGHGSCVLNNTCQCQDGWKGNLECSQYSCERVNNCNGRGACVGVNTCLCVSGYFGKECQYKTCFANSNNEMLNYGNRPFTMSERFCQKINKQLLV